jgi:hypothetical protein
MVPDPLLLTSEKEKSSAFPPLSRFLAPPPEAIRRLPVGLLAVQLFLGLLSHLHYMNRCLAGGRWPELSNGVTPTGGGHLAPVPRQPTTLFSKNDVIHLHHQREVLKDTTVMADVDVVEIRELHTNDFLRDIQVLRSKARVPMVALHLPFLLFHLVHS